MIALFKTWLSKSWILLGQRISTLDPCQELCLSWLGLPRREHKWTWLSRLGSHHSSEILHCSFFLETWQYPMSWNVTFFGNSMPPSLDNDCTRYSRLGFPSLETFWGKEFQHLTLAKNYVFHDLVFQDVTTSEHDCQDLAATGLKSYIFLCYNFATPCPQVLTKIALFKTWLSKSWNFLLYRLSAV